MLTNSNSSSSDLIDSLERTSSSDGPPNEEDDIISASLNADAIRNILVKIVVGVIGFFLINRLTGGSSMTTWLTQTTLSALLVAGIVSFP